MNILLADDHPMILDGTKAFLETLGYTVTYLCSNGTSALQLIERNSPDVAILDINMPEMSGIEVARQVQAKKLPCKIVLLTMHNEKNIYKRAMEYGVSGYLLKNFARNEIEECLNAIANYKSYKSPHLEAELVVNKAESSIEQLSVTERKIIEFISNGITNKQIGEKLFISERTIEWHRRNIIDKLELPKEKNSLLTWAMQNLKK